MVLILILVGATANPTVLGVYAVTNVKEELMRLHGSRTIANIHVELIISPDTLEPGIPVKFWMEPRDAVTGELIEEVPHELVILSNGKEVFREFSNSASYQHELRFTEEETGLVTIRLENIRNSEQDLQF